MSWTPAWRKEMTACEANPLILLGLKYTPDAEGSQRLVLGVLGSVPYHTILEEPSANSVCVRLPLELPSIGINTSMKLLEIIESPLMGLTPPSIGGHLAGGYLQPDTIEGEEESATKRYVVFIRSEDNEDVVAHNVTRKEATHEAQEAVKRITLNNHPDEVIANRKDDDTWTVQIPAGDFTITVKIEEVVPGNVYGDDA